MNQFGRIIVINLSLSSDMKKKSLILGGKKDSVINRHRGVEPKFMAFLLKAVKSWEFYSLYFFGSPARTRTTDMVVNSHPLYRLSYWGKVDLAGLII